MVIRDIDIKDFSDNEKDEFKNAIKTIKESCNESGKDDKRKNKIERLICA